MPIVLKQLPIVLCPSPLNFFPEEIQHYVDCESNDSKIKVNIFFCPENTFL